MNPSQTTQNFPLGRTVITPAAWKNWMRMMSPPHYAAMPLETGARWVPPTVPRMAGPERGFSPSLRIQHTERNHLLDRDRGRPQRHDRAYCPRIISPPAAGEFAPAVSYFEFIRRNRHDHLRRSDQTDFATTRSPEKFPGAKPGAAGCPRAWPPARNTAASIFWCSVQPTLLPATG